MKKTVENLRNTLLDVIDEVKSGSMERKAAETVINAAGKVHQGVLLELKEVELLNSNEQIPFLRYDNKKGLPENNQKQVSD